MKRRVKAGGAKRQKSDKCEQVFFIFVALHVIAAWVVNVNVIPHYLHDMEQINDDVVVNLQSKSQRRKRSMNHNRTDFRLSGEPIDFPITFLGNSGLGHRLGRQSAAYHLAKGLHLKSVDMDWGKCEKEGTSVPIWNYLFGDSANMQVQPQALASSPPIFPFVKNVYVAEENSSDESPDNNNMVFRYREARLLGEVPGYNPALRRQYDEVAFRDKIESDYEMYKAMIDRFQFYDHVKSFKEKHQFSEHTVIALHVRAGNGERGDFLKKKRDIPNIDIWMQNVGKLFSEMVHSNDPRFQASGEGKPPLVFFATDTPALIPTLTGILANYSIPLTTLDQMRIQRIGISTRGGLDSVDLCLETWKAQVEDAILLAESDIVVTGTYSSYTQTIPLSYQMHKAEVAAAKPGHITSGGKSQARLGVFCEVGQDASRLDCYDTHADWFQQTSPLPVYGDNKAAKQHVRKELFFLDTRIDVPYEFDRIFHGTGLVLEFEHSK